VVVGVPDEDLAVRARTADEPAKLLGDRDHPAAVVAQVEHQLVGACGAEVREGRGEGIRRRLHEVLEGEVHLDGSTPAARSMLGSGRCRPAMSRWTAASPRSWPSAIRTP